MHQPAGVGHDLLVTPVSLFGSLRAGGDVYELARAERDSSDQVGIHGYHRTWTDSYVSSGSPSSGSEYYCPSSCPPSSSYSSLSESLLGSSSAGSSVPMLANDLPRNSRSIIRISRYRLSHDAMNRSCISLSARCCSSSFWFLS